MFLYLILFFNLLTGCHSQMLIRLVILDDQDDPQRMIYFDSTNVTLCHQSKVRFEISWMNSSQALKNTYRFEQNQPVIFLARTARFSTRFIRDFCQIRRIPFFTARSIDQENSLTDQNLVFTPDVLNVLAGYLKFHRIQKVAYIYDHREATSRIYRFLKLINNDEYFNHFTLELRATDQEDIYSLLYNIEVNAALRDQPTKYILLDLDSYSDYEKMFDKVSHMGLTSELYVYIIVSTFDACLWTRQMNFTGRLVYFDFQQRDCSLDYQSIELPKTFSKPSISSIKTNERRSSYYRSNLSFRSEIDSSKSSQSSSTNNENRLAISTSKISIDQFDVKRMSNPCRTESNDEKEFFSFSDLYQRLPKSYRLHGRFLFNSINQIIRLFRSNSIDCQTRQIRINQSTEISLTSKDIFVYTSREKTMNINAKPTTLVGRYSWVNDEFQSCQVDSRSTSINNEQGQSKRIYHITSVFDEPFLMLRKRTDLYDKLTRGQINLKQLRGQIFEFNQLEGYCVDLAEKVCSILKINCRFRMVGDGAFGSKNATTGVWNGMVGDIVARRAEMAIAPLTISPSRMEVVDFSKPFMNLGISIMIRKPDAQKPGVFSFMNPVSMEIWLCFSLAYFAVSVVLFLTSRVVNSGWRRRIVRQPSYRAFGYPKSVNDRRKSEFQYNRSKSDSNGSEPSSESVQASPSQRPAMRRRHHYRNRTQTPIILRDEIRRINKKEGDGNENDVHLFGISNALFFSFASFMRQSINLVPKSFSGRIAATSWWYFSLIFVSSYTANLVAFLTVEKLVTPIESVEDLAKQQEIKYGSLINGTTSAFFEKSNVTVFQHMWAVMQRSSSEVFVTTNDEGVSKVRNSKGKYAFFIESTKNEYVNERLPCDTMKVGSDLDSKGYGIATGLGSDLTEAINIIITNLRESGFLDKLKQRWWYERSECPQTTKDKRFSELSLSSVTGLFYIFLFGVILSCAIAFTEFLITAKTESDKLRIDFREILRIKMIENLVGITINAQRQLEFDRVENACNYDYDNNDEDDHSETKHYHSIFKAQSDV